MQTSTWAKVSFSSDSWTFRSGLAGLEDTDGRFSVAAPKQ